MEKSRNMLWSTLFMSTRSAHDRRGFSSMNSLSKLLQSPGDVCEHRDFWRQAASCVDSPRRVAQQAAVVRTVKKKKIQKSPTNELKTGPYQRGPEGRRHLAAFHGLPVGGAKEGVQPDVSLHPQPLLGLPDKELRGGGNGGS